MISSHPFNVKLFYDTMNFQFSLKISPSFNFWFLIKSSPNSITILSLLSLHSMTLTHVVCFFFHSSFRKKSFFLFSVLIFNTVHFNCRKKVWCFFGSAIYEAISFISRLCKHAVNLWLKTFCLFGNFW